MVAVVIAKDGRVARGERSRVAVADALIALFIEGDVRPTAERIAARAGVSVRLVHHHFRDREALFQAAARRRFEGVGDTLAPIATEQPLALRIEELVKRRSRLLETITPVRRAAVLEEPFSSMLARGLAQIRAMKRAQVTATFAPEVERQAGAARADLIAALGVVTSWSTWEALRAHQQLPVAQARRALTMLLTRLLAAPEATA